MPERLLFVISGILAGGIPGFRMELCCFSHPPIWPIGVFCVCSVLFLVLGHSQIDTEDVIMHVIPIAGGDPILSVVFVWLLLWLCVFCLFGLLCCFWFAFLSVFLLGQLLDCVLVRTGTFVAFDKLTALHVNYNSTVCRD